MKKGEARAAAEILRAIVRALPSMVGRGGLRDALAAVEAGRVGGLVTAKIDRLGRSSADVCGLVERAVRERWRLVALDVGLDSTTPAGEMVVAALAMAARFEYRRISERQLEKHDELRRQGRPRGDRLYPPRSQTRSAAGERRA